MFSQHKVLKQLPETFDSFHNGIITEAIVSLKLNHFTDNFDYESYPNMPRTGVFDPFELLNEFNGFYNHSGSLFKAYSLLQNEQSRMMFIAIIVYRLVGHLSYKVPVSYNNSPIAYEEYLRNEIFFKSETTIASPFEIKYFDFHYNDKHYVGDYFGLAYNLFRRQYYYQEGGDVVVPEEGDFVIDGGACLGDTALTFSNDVGANGKIYTFDPVQEHLEILYKNIEKFTYKNVVVFPVGLGNVDKEGVPISLVRIAPGFRIDDKIPVAKIDTLVRTQQIEKIDYIKLDVEGSELEAIKGAALSIIKFKPKLAISLYHKPNDMFEIILFIQRMFPFYDFFIGHYTIHRGETVLYCRPQKSMKSLDNSQPN